MDDNMLEEVLEQMLHETEDETDKNLFPAAPDAKDGHTVTITIEHGKAPDMKKDEPEDGGYADLMKGLE